VDRRVQEAIQLVYHEDDELGSVRQVLLWFGGKRYPCQLFPGILVSARWVWKFQSTTRF